MTPSELQEEIEQIKKAMEKKDVPEGERAVLRQKWLLGRSYALQERQFPQGAYAVEDSDKTFQLDYVNGVMGWGTWSSGEKGAVPLAQLIGRSET